MSAFQLMLMPMTGWRWATDDRLVDGVGLTAEREAELLAAWDPRDA